MVAIQRLTGVSSIHTSGESQRPEQPAISTSCVVCCRRHKSYRQNVFMNQSGHYKLQRTMTFFWGLLSLKTDCISRWGRMCSWKLCSEILLERQWEMRLNDNGHDCWHTCHVGHNEQWKEMWWMNERKDEWNHQKRQKTLINFNEPSSVQYSHFSEILSDYFNILHTLLKTS